MLLVQTLQVRLHAALLNKIPENSKIAEVSHNQMQHITALTLLTALV